MSNITDAEEIMSLPPEQLDLIDHDVYKWYCSAYNCKCYTTVRDYGIHPFYYSPHKRDKKEPWMHSKDWWYLCGKHNKVQKRYPDMPLKELFHMHWNMERIKQVKVSDIKLRF